MCTAPSESLLPVFCGLENRVDIIAVFWLVISSADTVARALVHKETVDKELAPGRNVDRLRRRD